MEQGKLQAMSSLTLLDWFATFAPEPIKEQMDIERHKDRNKAHSNDRFIARDDIVIICELKYKYARAMLQARA